jgi:hypothetical protein
MTVLALAPWACRQQTEADLSNKSSCFAAALGVTKFIAINILSLVTLLCCLSQTLVFDRPSSEQLQKCK